MLSAPICYSDDIQPLRAAKRPKVLSSIFLLNSSLDSNNKKKEITEEAYISIPYLKIPSPETRSEIHGHPGKEISPQWRHEGFFPMRLPDSGTLSVPMFPEGLHSWQHLLLCCPQEQLQEEKQTKSLHNSRSRLIYMLMLLKCGAWKCQSSQG